MLNRFVKRSQMCAHEEQVALCLVSVEKTCLCWWVQTCWMSVYVRLCMFYRYILYHYAWVSMSLFSQNVKELHVQRAAGSLCEWLMPLPVMPLVVLSWAPTQTHSYILMLSQTQWRSDCTKYFISNIFTVLSFRLTCTNMRSISTVLDLLDRSLWWRSCWPHKIMFVLHAT